MTGEQAMRPEVALSAPPPGEPSRAGRMSAWLLAAVGVLGLGISAYLTHLHYSGGVPLCSTGGIVNCAAVTSSSYSVVPGTGLPVTVPGMVWFIVSGVLAAMSLRCLHHGVAEPRWLRPAHMLWAAGGLLAVLYLVYAEVVRLHSICEWCTAVHALVFVSLLATLARLQRRGPAAGP